MNSERAFSPEWVSPPGDTIAHLLEERGWTQADLAQRLGFTPKHVNTLVQGEAVLSPDAAQRLATVLGSTAEFWLTREAQYRAALEQRRQAQSFSGQTEWLSGLPVRWMVKQGWIPGARSKAAQVGELLSWFGVASVDAWRATCTAPLAAFRASSAPRKTEGAVAAWLRAAELAAAKIECSPYDAVRFRESLSSLRDLTRETEPAVFVQTLQQTCAERGVAVVFVPAPPGCPIHGATRWLTPEKALLALSLRYKSNDQLWFSFFHEAGHLVKHGKKLLFVEGLNGLDATKEEEANTFAADLLIPPADAAGLRGLKSAAGINARARDLGVAPGILVGRMQYEGWLPPAHLNHLKVRYEWARTGNAESTTPER